MLAKQPQKRARLVRWTAVLAALSAALCFALQACSGQSPPIDTSPIDTHPVSTACSTPAAGCPCGTSGETAACGATVSSSGGQTECMSGTLTCSGGIWGACVPAFTSFVSRQRVSLDRGHASPQLLSNDAAVGEAGACDPCDPYCESFNGDNSTGVDGGPGLLSVNGGWTLADATPPPDVDICTGNQCYVAACEGGTTTQLVGTILDPAGRYPVNNALVLIPNDGVIPTMTDGVNFNPCSGSSLPPALAVATTGPNGVFTLGDPTVDGGGSVPTQALPIQVSDGGDSGTGPVSGVPILVQVGRWRRLVTVNVTQACQVNDAGPIALPSVQGGAYGQDNIPHVAIITSSCDPFECMINTIGVDRTQFSAFGGGGRIELLYAYDQGTINDAGTGTVNGLGNPHSPAIIMLPDGGFPDAAVSGYDQLLKSTATVDNYDLVMLPCRCGDEYEGPSNANGPSGNYYTDPTTAIDYDDINGYRQTLSSYANAGGRVFTSHWGREWIERQAIAFDAGPGGCAPDAGACGSGATVTQSSCSSNPACSWTGGCSQTNACPSAPGTTSVSCTSLGAGGDPLCTWNSASCSQATACPTLDGGTTKAQCTGADSQCSWTGACEAPSCPADAGQSQCTSPCTWNGTCSAPVCPTADAGVTAATCLVDGGGFNACSFTGSCALAIGSCPTNPTSKAACTQLDAGGDPQCTWAGSGCGQTTACPTAMTATGSQCTGADPQCQWTGACAAPSCPTSFDAGAAACGAAGCSFTGSCGLAIGSCPAQATSIAGCTQLDAGGDPQCSWSNGACAQASACPSGTNNAITQASCSTTAGGGNPQCSWTGSCSAPACNNLDAGTTATACTTASQGGNSACAYTGACAFAGGACGTNASAASCTVGGTLASSCAFVPNCQMTNPCPTGSQSVTSASCTTVGGNGDPLCNWTGSCSAPSCPTAIDAGASACNAATGCAFSGSCSVNTATGACPTHATSPAACTQAVTGGDPQCTWNNASACQQTNACPISDAGVTSASCTTLVGGGDPQCLWTGSCSAPSCPVGGGVDAGSCRAISGCSFTGSCGQTTACAANATSNAACTQPASGGDPQCNWTGSACSQTNACPVTGGGVTQSQCTTLAAGGDPQCSWTGSCTAPTCPSGAGVDAGSCAAASSACSWTGSCSMTASCPANAVATQASCSGACSFNGGSSPGNGCVGSTTAACQSAEQSSGGAGCTAANCLFDAGSAGGNGCVGASAGTCTTLTGTACTTAGCFWGGGCTSSCSLQGTKTGCQGVTGCTWSTDNSTCEPTAGACSGNNTTSCQASGSTCTFSGCSAPSCPTGSGVTPSACTTHSDGGTTGCAWVGSCAAPTCPTDPNENQTSCTSVTGCRWVGSCASNSGACTGQGAESTCGAVGLDGGAPYGVGCTWDAGAGNSANGCTAAPTSACTTAAPNGENACTSAGCVWDGGTNANGCSAPAAGAGCTSATAEQSQVNCGLVTGGGCSWDKGGVATCVSGGGCSVTGAASATGCGALSGCVWDAGANGGNGCASPGAGSCSTYGSESTCSSNSCAWDAGPGASANGCTAPGVDAGCNTALGESSAANCTMPGCFWNATVTTCSGGSACTASTSEYGCNSVAGGGCVWDGGASGSSGNGCAPTGDASACGSQGSEQACNTSSCIWDAGASGGNGCALTTDLCAASGAQTTASCLAVDNSTVTGACKWSGTCTYLDASCPTLGVSEGVCNGTLPQADGGFLAGCAFNPGAMGNNGCGGPTQLGITCSSETSQGQCRQAQGGYSDKCLWDSGVGASAPNGCSAPGTDAGCSTLLAEQSQAYCTTTLSGCSWNGAATTCSGGTACTGAATQTEYACATVTGGGCVWDAGTAGGSGNGCSGPAACGDAGSQSSCTTAGCLWDAGASGGNGCATTGFCTSSSAELSQAACAAVDGGGCGWDAGATSCTGSGNACGVSAAQSEQGCGTIDGGGCVWDAGGSGGNGCAGATTATCATGTASQAACAGDKCIWGGGCSGASTATCGAEGSQVTCGDAGCLWDAGANGGNGCATSGFCTSSGAESSQASCQGVDGGGCVWDGGCTAPAAGTGCAADTSQSTCGTGCTWTGACASLCTGPTPSLCSATNGCSWSGSTGLGSGAVPYGWAPFPGVAIWEPDVDAPGNGVAYFNSTPGFTRGDGLAAWLTATGAFSPSVPFTVGDPKTDVLAVANGSANFVYGWEPDAAAGGVTIDAGLPWEAGGPNTIYSFTFDPSDGGVDGGATGRVMFTDMHLSTNLQQTSPPYIKVLDSVAGSIQAPVFNTSYSLGANLPPFNQAGAHECLLPEAGLPSAEELAAEYLLFDLGACQAIGLPPGFVPQQYLATETFTRDYCVAPSGSATNSGCPVTCQTANSSVVWRDFDWTSIIPNAADAGTFGPNITFAFQTAATEAELGVSSDGGAGASPLYTLAPDTTSGSFAKDVNTVLGTNNSQTWLRVSMTLNPDSTHQVGPTLTSWAQQFDCVPSQ